MKTLNNWLDDAKAKSGSDYATAKAMNVTRQALSKIRIQGSMNNNTARKLAEYLEVNPIEIIASMEAERHPEEAINWQKWVAACLIIGILGASENAINTGFSGEILNSPVIDYA